MRAAKVERVKRRVLREAVAENLDVIRGLPPRNVRAGHRFARIWLRRAPLLLVPLTLAASYLALDRQPVPPSGAAGFQPAGIIGG
ncbi:MAG TPA: hypothetical protein VHL59_17410, partial [Thermoanaerobaculia bacterium]|nr:hypothetical protein [Thermoanaerobaculia bacterium]